jgi:hypothetical protein
LATEFAVLGERLATKSAVLGVRLATKSAVLGVRLATKSAVLKEAYKQITFSEKSGLSCQSFSEILNISEKVWPETHQNFK